MAKNKENTFSVGDLFRAFWYFLEGRRVAFVFWTTTLIVILFYQVVPPIIVSKIVDFFTAYQSGQPLILFFIYIAILGISHAVVSMIRLTAKNKVANLETDAIYHAKVWGFEKLLDFSLRWHDAENTGNKVQRIMKGTQAIRTIRGVMSQTGFSAISSFVGIIFVFLWLQPAFVIFVVVYTLVLSFIQMSYYRRTLATINYLNKAEEQASGTYYEGVSNVVTLKTLGAKESFKTSVYSREQNTKKFSYETRRLGYTKWKLFQVFNALSVTVYFLMVGQGVISGTISIGAIVIFYNYFNRLMEAVTDSAELFEDLIEAKATIGRMMPLYWKGEEEEAGQQPFPEKWDEIMIRKGFFSYKKDRSFALTNIYMTVKRFEKIGVVGHSGSGKSTLAKLLLGLYKFDKGTLSVGKIKISDIRHSELTKHVAIVLQDAEMFNLSLQENITLMREVDPQIFAQAIEIAQLKSLIEKLPEGVETLIGEKGYRLSGGERQRLGIARAICRDPEILVMDEATSSLDSKTEQLIHQALETNLKKKTLIIIAHRVSTLRNVDRIYVFNKGEIVEEGRYDELMKNTNSVFYQVYISQQKKEE